MLVLFTLLVVLLALAAMPWSDLSRRRPTSATAARLDLSVYDAALLPDRIRLAPISSGRFRDRPQLRAATIPLLAQGFRRGGNYAVTGWPGLRVRLLANRDECLIAALHDHDAAGVWVEITSRYADGTALTHTTLEGAGLDPHPGHTVRRLPGATAEELLDRARAERLREGLRRTRSTDLSAQYEQAYADWIAWRKSGLRPVPKIIEHREAA